MQGLAVVGAPVMGIGLRPHSARRAMASPSPISRRNVALAAGRGNTLNETSSMMPSVPWAPTMSRERS